jgi:hypothetical protein
VTGTLGELPARHLRVLEARCTLSAPPAILEPIAFAYRRFEVERPDPTARRIELRGGAVVVDGRPSPLVQALDPVLQLYRRFLDVLMDGIGSHLLLHAAALADDDGGATLLAAPSGHGKSSLTLELLDRGMRFLGDDYAPLDAAGGTIHPYPRALALVPGSDAIPERFRAAARSPAAVHLLGKTLVDVGQVLGPERLMTEPAILRQVVLLAGDDFEPATATTRIDAAASLAVADRIEADLAAIDGVEIVARRQGDHLRSWQLELDHARHPTARLNRLLDRDAVLVSQKVWTSRPGFDGPAQAVPVPRRVAAEWLGREMLNRRDGGRLLARYGGSAAALFFDLARALSHVECYRVRMGGRRETADLVRELVRSGQTKGT